MGKLLLPYTRIKADPKKYSKGSFNSLSESEFKKFNESILDLGDISRKGKYIQSLSAIFDLEGFTVFCNQVDSHLVVPEFLTRFLEWIFQEISEQFVEGKKGTTVTIWGSLPFYAKFLGDGVLFLWDTEFSGGDTGIRNIIVRLRRITKKYISDLLPILNKNFSNPPSKLRCGIARGQILSVGDEKDYVGSCINIAARLQKLSKLTFAVSKRGIDFSTARHVLSKDLILRKVELRGIGKDELVYVLKNELELLPIREQRFFKEP